MRLGAAQHDWLQQLRLTCSIMLMRLQELCKICKFCRIPVILFYCKWANRFNRISGEMVIVILITLCCSVLILHAQQIKFHLLHISVYQVM